MQQHNEPTHMSDVSGRPTRLSYKFQRLRERIRNAILNGEFQNRLPGERELGKIFNANAKTINKALCDLSSEGLLVRQIGRGTFIAGRAEATAAAGGRNTICFMPEHGAESHLQKRIFDAVRIEANSSGHALNRMSYNAEEVALNEWPSPARRGTEGIFCIPGSPLGGGNGHISDGLMMEAYRRHVPIVVLGACAAGSKMNAVVPDFVDAGYRLAEHLFRLGCQTVVMTFGHPSREVEAVVSGAGTAAARYHGQLRSCPLRGSDRAATECCINSHFEEAHASRRSDHIGPGVGIVLIGIEALRFARSNDNLMKRWRAGEVALTTVLDAGDSLAADMEMTAYEIPVDRIAAWGVKLLNEVAPGQRPVEVLIPGVLKVRNSIAPEAHPGAHGTIDGQKASEAAAMRDRVSETSI